MDVELYTENRISLHPAPKWKMEQKIFAFRSNWKMDVDLNTQKIFACPIGGKERERKEVFCILFLEIEAAVQATYL